MLILILMMIQPYSGLGLRTSILKARDSFFKNSKGVSNKWVVPSLNCVFDRHFTLPVGVISILSLAMGPRVMYWIIVSSRFLW